MKKLIAITIILSSIGIVGFSNASASVVCLAPDHAVWNDLNNTVVGCILATQWEKEMAAAASRNDKKLPYVAPGAIVTDEGGWQDSCPSWYVMGCVNLSKTDKYRQDMLSLARQLVASGRASQFPSFAGWIAMVR